MSDSQQLPLFDLPGEAEPHKPKPRRRAHHADPSEIGETLPLITDDTPILTFAPAAKPAPPPKPAPALKLKYPSPSRLLPTIFNAPSVEVLEWLAPRAVEAGDAPDAAAALVEILRDPGTGHSPDQRANAAIMLRLLGQSVDVEPLVAGMWQETGSVPLALAETLGEVGTWPETPFTDIERIVHGLIVALRHSDAETRAAAARSLGKMGAVAAVPDMINRLDLETDDSVREVIVMVMSDLGTTETIEGILNAYDGERVSYDLACRAMINAGHNAAETLLAVLIGWTDRVLSRALAADVLAHLGITQAVDPLIAITRSPAEPDAVRAAAERALRVLNSA